MEFTAFAIDPTSYYSRAEAISHDPFKNSNSKVQFCLELTENQISKLSKSKASRRPKNHEYLTNKLCTI